MRAACPGIGWPCPPRGGIPTPEVLISRLVLWNIDLTLIDVDRITREAYAEAFRRVTGRPMVQLPQLPGRMESEIFFEALALNEAVPTGLPSPATAGGEELLARFSFELANSFAARRTRRSRSGPIPGQSWSAGPAGTRWGVARGQHDQARGQPTQCK